MKCRYCKNELRIPFVDLGMAPPSNAYLTQGMLQQPEPFFPLKVSVCSECWLVQTDDYNKADELFNHDYAYFSSTSTSWLTHAKDYCNKMMDILNLNEDSFVVELASNDGYLLKNFVEARVPCLGVEPTNSTADRAEENGVPTLRKFFGEDCAFSIAKDKKANLIAANNVYAHVPDIKDFTMGIKVLLAATGTVTIEFPHLLELIKHSQFDTVYHEHYSYLSLTFVNRIFDDMGLRVYDVEKLGTHGGSLRIYGCHSGADIKTSENVYLLLNEENAYGMKNADIYESFQGKAQTIRNEFLTFLIDAQNNNKNVIGYGAAAKGNTLMNYAGIKADMIDFVCDSAPSKQGKYLPGTHISIMTPDVIQSTKPDYIIVFPWNIIDEVKVQLSYINEWSGKLVTFVPCVKIHDN
jgi:hypothetical protein